MYAASVNAYWVPLCLCSLNSCSLLGSVHKSKGCFIFRARFPIHSAASDGTCPSASGGTPSVTFSRWGRVHGCDHLAPRSSGSPSHIRICNSHAARCKVGLRLSPRECARPSPIQSSQRTALDCGLRMCTAWRAANCDRAVPCFRF